MRIQKLVSNWFVNGLVGTAGFMAPNGHDWWVKWVNMGESNPHNWHQGMSPTIHLNWDQTVGRVRRAYVICKCKWDTCWVCLKLWKPKNPCLVRIIHIKMTIHWSPILRPHIFQVVGYIYIYIHYIYYIPWNIPWKNPVIVGGHPPFLRQTSQPGRPPTWSPGTWSRHLQHRSDGICRLQPCWVRSRFRSSLWNADWQNQPGGWCSTLIFWGVNPWFWWWNTWNSQLLRGKIPSFAGWWGKFQHFLLLGGNIQNIEDTFQTAKQQLVIASTFHPSATLMQHPNFQIRWTVHTPHHQVFQGQRSLRLQIGLRTWRIFPAGLQQEFTHFPLVQQWKFQLPLGEGSDRR